MLEEKLRAVQELPVAEENKLIDDNLLFEDEPED